MFRWLSLALVGCVLSSCTPPAVFQPTSPIATDGIQTCAFLGKTVFLIVPWHDVGLPISTVYMQAPKLAKQGLRKGLLDTGTLSTDDYLAFYKHIAWKMYTEGPADTPQGMRHATEVFCFSIWDQQEARQHWLRY